MSTPGQEREPQSGIRLSPLALGGWLVGALAVGALLWSRRPVSAPTPPPSPAPEALPAVEPWRPPATVSPSAPAREAAGFSLEEVVGRGIGAVVVVETSRGRGSAFFVSDDTLLTNFHVLAGNAYVTIRKTGGETATAYPGATSADFDLAVLKVSGSARNAVFLPLGTAADLRAGQEVIAIGSPLGLQNSVTRGIVSGVRQMGPVSVVQTDAAVNPGNSGGPLLDRNGNVIGINTFMMGSGHVAGAQGGSQGLNFAIAIDHAKALLEGRPASAGALADPGPTNTLISAEAPSESDRQQAQGARAYEARLVQLAQHADAMDQDWDRFLATGFQGRAEGTYDHPWYCLYVEGALKGSVTRGHERVYASLRARAEEIRNASRAFEDAARQAGVLPGVRRDLRRRYRLDYAGWGL